MRSYLIIAIHGIFELKCEEGLLSKASPTRESGDCLPVSLPTCPVDAISSNLQFPNAPWRAYVNASPINFRTSCTKAPFDGAIGKQRIDCELNN
ncbi:unnamed protein product, partial [Iphiclides podalirius]